MIVFNYVLMCFIFGTTFLVIKIGVDAGLPPFFSAGLRFWAAGALIYIWMLWKGRVRLDALLRKEFAAIGACLTFITFAALYWAEQHIASGIAAVLSATGPLLILGMQGLFGKRRTTGRMLAGCLIGFAGVLLLILPNLMIEWKLVWALSCLLVLVGEIGYAVGSLYSRRVIVNLKDIPPIGQNAVQMMYGGAGLLLLSAFTEQPSLDALASVPAAGSLLYLVIAGSMLGHSLYYWLLSATNAVFPSTWLYVSPLIALGVGAAWYGERITWISALGAGLILAGVAIANLDTLKKLNSFRTAS